MGKHASGDEPVTDDAEATGARLSSLEDDLLAIASRLGLDGFLRDLRATRGAS